MAVNGDEGEPGTFKDRYYLGRDPHRFIEGMLIAAWVVEAKRGLFLSARRISRTAADAARGNREGRGGRPVTAHPSPSAARRRRLHLRRRIRDDRIDRGQARAAAASPALCRAGRHFRPSDAGAECRDAVLDPRHRRAAAPTWFTSHGRHERKGFRSFSVSGRVKNPGVKLAPAGITMRELIEEYCGGMQDGHKLQGLSAGRRFGRRLAGEHGRYPARFRHAGAARLASSARMRS